MKRHAIWSALGLLAFTAGVFPTAAWGQDNGSAGYSITSLGTLGGKYSDAFAVNGRGQIVGVTGTKYGPSHAFLYDHGAMQNIGTLGGENSEAFAINASGEVVGESDVGSGRHAFLYDHGRMHDLGTLGGANSRAKSINDSGLIVGDSEVILQNPLAVDSGAAGWHAFVYRGGKMRDLAGIVSSAAAVNDSGQIVGSAMFNPDKNNSVFAIRRAALFGKDVLEDFGLPINNVSVATAMNASGQVAGSANYNTPDEAAGHHYHAFLFDHSTSQDLGTLGGEESRANAINSSGEVVGTADTASNGRHSFLFDGDRMLDLDWLAKKSGWTPSGFSALTTAYGINDRGQIVGVGTNAGGRQIAFLLTPIAPKQ